MTEEFIVYGIHPVREALDQNRNIDSIFINKNIQEKESFADILFEAKKRLITIKSVPEEKLRRLVNGNHQGIIAYISPVPYYDLEEIIKKEFDSGKTPLFIVLDGITDVRNFGAIARSAYGAAASAIVIPATGSAGIGPDAIKTSAGALMHIPVCKVRNLKDAIYYFQGSGIRVFAASEKARKKYSNADFSVPMAIIMGSEEKGVSASLLKIADEWVQIPMPGKLASLNVSVSAGILMYEALRQRDSEL
ncbi:MAG: 23S rRNA (guanosine(2251)-2'-O)-methyltransferase RlmB [Bacteroidales bacterium]|nr:23S rRNA (guanosine(2251)-2'-O)-methyltransferase RlmB [Bacteroidales bacterium]